MGPGPVSQTRLAKAMKVPKKRKIGFVKTLDRMASAGKITAVRGGGFSLPDSGNFIRAEVVKSAPRFAFVKSLEKEGEEYFIPPFGLKGAVLGDEVQIQPLTSRAGSAPEAAIREIISQANENLTGVFHRGHKGAYVSLDSVKVSMVVEGKLKGAKDGDKVAVDIIKRGKNLRDHVVRIIRVFGNAQIAAVCAEAILSEHGVEKEFPPQVIEEAEKLVQRGILPQDLKGRTDLRDEVIFTIDGADAKDLDDAISISRVREGYRLGVHIADVSYYVQNKSALDKEAYHRGTSIYYANKVIPMLPEALSNGICSLTPHEDRLTFSAFLHINGDGELLSYTFEKSVIRSRVKGVYTEVNRVLEGSAAEELQQKYAGVMDSLELMKTLAEGLDRAKKKRGSFALSTKESKILIDKSGVAEDVVPRTRGFSECLIEDFMLMANQAAATYAREKEIPFIYRVHESPSEEKVKDMGETLNLLGVTTKKPEKSMSQQEISSLLKKVEGTSLEAVVSYRVLRMMAKARYEENPLGHYGLVLKNYAHFTSPIRRYPDLVIHRILSDLIKSGPDKAKKYQDFVKQAAKRSSERELAAMTVERDCEDCYKAEYMKLFLGEEREGIIVGFSPQGMYVELENTVQGRIALEDLPKGQYELEGSVRYRDVRSKKAYTIGDTIGIVVAKADVETGNIDFVLQNE